MNTETTRRQNMRSYIKTEIHVCLPYVEYARIQ